MMMVALNIALAGFGLALLMNLWPILRGPSLADRILALDTLVINMIALIVLYGIRSHSNMTFDAALLLAMTGFVSTVALCRFLLRGQIIE